MITIERHEAGFGFRIVGGTEEGSQVSIGHIVEGGATEMDGRLRSGDEIVSVDNQHVMNCSHHHVVQLMGKAAANGRVTLGIRRKMPFKNQSNYSVKKRTKRVYTLLPLRKCANTIVSSFLVDNAMLRPEVRYPYDVTINRQENEGFGFVIISSLNKAGSAIGRL